MRITPISYRPSARSRVFKLRPVVGEAAGFAQVGALYAAAVSSMADSIFVDCSLIKWLDAHLTAAYAAIQRLASANTGVQLQFISLATQVREIFEHHGLIGFRPDRPKRSVIPVTNFQPGDSKLFAEYTQKNLRRLPIPSMSKAVEQKFFEGIDELFSNAELHSKTQLGIYACGQYFPKKEKLDFTIVDLGLGFERVVNNNTGLTLSSHEAINWAMSGQNTTRAGDIPGGLGLKILKDFVGLNGGRLTVISHGGHWCLQAGKKTQGPMTNVFPGTALVLEIRTNDQRSYYTQEELGNRSGKP